MFIGTQIIGLVLTLCIYVIWNLHHKLDSVTDNIFALSTVVAIISQIGDILCQFVMSGTLVTSELGISIVVDFYLATIPCYVLSIALYTVRTIFDTNTYAKIRTGIFIFAFVSTAIMIILPGGYDRNSYCSLPTGASTFYTYVISGLVAVCLIALLLKYKKQLAEWKFFANLIWVCIFIVGGILQFALINTLYVPIISFVIGIGTLALYMIIENPGNRFDYEQNCFHYDAFIDYINETIINKEIKSILYLNIAFKNNNNFIYIKDIFDDLIKTHDKNRKIKIFKGHHDELIVASRQFVEIQNFGVTIFNSINKIEKKIGSYQDYQAAIVLISGVRRIENFESLRGILDAHKVRNNVSNELIEVYDITDDIIDSFNNESMLVSQVDEAIKNNRVTVSYRTINSKSNKNVVNAEALVSLETDNKLLVPSDYLLVAEKYNKFIQIDEMSLTNVCNAVSQICKFQNSLGVVFVRVSVQIIENENFVKEYVSLLSRYNVPLTKICLEITNANAIKRKELFINNLKALKNHGVKIAIGGFGSGESNLNYFIDLPIDYVKFDQSMLVNALAEEKAAMIMKEITNLAYNLGFLVISVGIENVEGKKLVEDCSIDLSMGNLISRDYSEKEFIDYVSIEGVI